MGIGPGEFWAEGAPHVGPKAALLIRRVSGVGKRLPHELDMRGKDPFRFTCNAKRKTETPTISGAKRR